MHYLDKEASAELAKNEKYIAFKKWLIDNGARFDRVISNLFMIIV